MIEKHCRGIWIECGEYSAHVTDIPFGKDAIARYLNLEGKLGWIKNDKMRCYILIKIIKGMNEGDVFNFILDKKHLLDIDYRGLVYGGI